MKFLTLIAALLINCTCIWTQERGQEPEPPVQRIANQKESKTPDNDSATAVSEPVAEADPVKPEVELSERPQEIDLKTKIDEEFSPLKPEKIDILEEVKSKSFPGKPLEPQSNGGEKFHWKSAMIESLYFLGIQQGLRMVQIKTRREIEGPFFRDWGNSVKNLGRWRDGDSTFTNYVAHPMQGAVTGRIFLNNSERSHRLEFGNSEEYWKSRFKALAWSAVWSTQFELGPVSEASIGNVGLYDREGPNRMGWVDLVITPTAGTAVIIGEDAIDKYILKNWLENSRPRWKIRLFRMFITPFQSFTNVLHGQLPWKRYNRH